MADAETHRAVEGPAGVRGVDARSGQGVQVGDGGLQINYYGQPPPEPAGGVPVGPVVVGHPPLVAAAFQDRPALRERLRAALAPAGASLVTTVVLSGDGGIGKTQLAARTFEQATLERSDDLYLWVTASSSAAIVDGFARAAERVQAGWADDDPGRRARRFLEWLRETDRAWLIVLDDVGDPVDVREWWPAGPTGRTLVTTRRRDAMLSEQGRTVIDMTVFEPPESAAYLAVRLSAARPDVLTAASSLAADLGHLPLALSQAAAVILDDGTTCADYQRRFHDRSSSLDDVFGERGDDRLRTVAATWSLAVRAAQELPPRNYSRPLLALIAALDPNGVPESVLTSEAAGDQVRSWGNDHPMSPERLRQTLRNLHRLSLISHDPSDPVRSVRMHALAQRATRESLDADGRRHTYRFAATALVQAWPAVARDQQLGSVLRGNSAVLANNAGDTLWQPDVHPLIFRAGRSLGQAGLTDSAVAYWRDAELTGTRVLGPDHPETLAARHNLGYSRGYTGDFQGAADAFEQILADRVRVLGRDHPQTLSTRHEFGRWRGEAGDLDGAAAIAEEVVADHLRVLGPDHPNTLVARHNQAIRRGELGFPAEAAALLEQVLVDRQRVLGPDHPSTLSTSQTLGRWLGAAGDANAAVALLEELLADQVRALGPDNPFTLITRHAIAHWRGEAGDPAGAASSLEELLADQLRVLGPDHRATLATDQNIRYWRARAAGQPLPDQIPYWHQAGQ